MVIYDLVCENHHGFEGWFKDAQDYAAQLGSDLVRCPACDSADVKRKPSSVNISGKKSNQAVTITTDNEKSDNSTMPDVPLRFTTTAEQAEVIRHFVEKNFEDVGNEFSTEARKMHYGEAEERGIRGEATAEEIADLEEEGIQTFSIPVPKVDKKNMN